MSYWAGNYGKGRRGWAGNGGGQATPPSSETSSSTSSSSRGHGCPWGYTNNSNREHHNTTTNNNTNSPCDRSGRWSSWRQFTGSDANSAPWPTPPSGPWPMPPSGWGSGGPSHGWGKWQCPCHCGGPQDTCTGSKQTCPNLPQNNQQNNNSQQNSQPQPNAGVGPNPPATGEVPDMRNPEEVAWEKEQEEKKRQSNANATGYGGDDDKLKTGDKPSENVNPAWGASRYSRYSTGYGYAPPPYSP